MDDHHTESSGADGNDENHLPLYFYDLTPKLKQQAKEELHEDDKTMQLALNEFRASIQREKCMNFPTSDEDIIPFLRCRKYDVKRAYTTYKKYFSHFSTYNNLYKDFEFISVLKVLRANGFEYLPKRDADGAIIAVILTKKWDTSINATDLLRSAIVTYMDLLRCPITHITGAKVIADCSHLSLENILTCRPWHMKVVSEHMQGLAPVRIKGYHFLNHGRFFYAIWNMLKPLMSEKILKRTHFHGDDVKSLHRYISPSVLPEELGGTMGPWDNTEFIENFARSEDLITRSIQKFRGK